MEPLVGVKIGCLFAMLVVSLVCGLIPICFKWFQMKAARGRPPRGLSLLSCISAGVFLGAGFMHLMVESLENIELKIQKIKMKDRTENGGNSSEDANSADDKDYPYGGLIISLGFFFVFFLESLALQCCPQTIVGSEVQEEKVNDAHDHGLHSQEPSPSRSPLRALILLFSLSFHSVFEGLAVGLQATIAYTVQLSLAVLAHKGPVVFSVGLRLVQIGTTSGWAIFYILLFALMSPLGIALGLVVPERDSEGGQGLAQAVLEGMAAGTFLYVTFLEILPRELAGPEAPLVKWGCIATGFAFMALIALWA